MEGVSVKRKQSKGNKKFNMSNRWIEAEGVSGRVFVCAYGLSGKMTESKEMVEFLGSLLMCQHCWVWEVARGGTLCGTQGRNSTALSTETLIIHLHRFGKAKQPDKKTGGLEPKLRSTPSTRLKGSWKVYSFQRQESDAWCVEAKKAYKTQIFHLSRGLIRFLTDFLIWNKYYFHLMELLEACLDLVSHLGFTHLHLSHKHCWLLNNCSLKDCSLNQNLS